MTTGKDALGQGQEPPGLGPHTNTHTQGTWCRSNSKIQNRRYVNDSSIAIGDFLHLCGKLYSKPMMWWKCWKSMQSEATRKSKVALCICVVLHGRDYCVNEWRFHNHSTAETGTKTRETRDCMFKAWHQGTAAVAAICTCGMKRRNELSDSVCLSNRNNYSQGQNITIAPSEHWYPHFILVSSDYRTQFQ